MTKNARLTEKNTLLKLQIATKNAMYCLFLDYNVLSYCRNEEDFIAEFGYDEKTGRKVYKKLISIFDRLNELFDENTYEVLEKTYENY